MKIKDKLQEWENKLYGLNSQISLRWIGLKQKPTDEEIMKLNEFIASLIKDIRKFKENHTQPL